MTNNNKTHTLIFSVFLLIICLFNIGVAVDPVKSPWPNIFSEAFTLIVESSTSGKISTSGVHWYNWNIKSMQLDYSNSEVFHSCYQYIKTKTPCTIVYRNQN